MTDSNVDRSAVKKPFRRLLLTGAAGNLGKQLRPALADWADIVRVHNRPSGDFFPSVNDRRADAKRKPFCPCVVKF